MRHFLWLVCGRCLLVFVAMLVMGGLLLALPGARGGALAAQEQSAIRLDVQAGYNENYRVSQWFPVTVVATNTGPDVQGTIEWLYPNHAEGLEVRHQIDLPQGARKQVEFYALANGFIRRAEIRLRVDGEIVYEQDVRLMPIEVERFAVGVVSSDATLLNSLSAINPANTSGTILVHMDAAMLPENAMALAGIDALFVHDARTANLTPAQREALALWVRLGGSLVVSGGINAEDTVPGLSDLLPVEVQDLQSDVSLDALAELVPQTTRAPGVSTTVNQVGLLPGARALDDANLLTAHSVGSGQVVFSAFDVGVLRAWRNEADLWEQVLDTEPEFAPAAAFRWQHNNPLFTILQLPELSLPSFGVLVLFIAGYILAVGPLNFLILRRIKRIDLAWATVPAVVVLFVVAAYGASFWMRGARAQFLQVAIVQSFEGAEQGQATAFQGIFSPRRQTYELAFASETLASSGRFGQFDFDETHLLWTGTATLLQDVLIDVSSLRTFIVEQTIVPEARAQSSLQREGRTLVGEVRNQGSIPLLDAMIVARGSVQQLGTLQPGDAAQIDLDLQRNNFPHMAEAREEGLFNRQEMLDMLFSPNRFRGAFVRPPGPGANNDSLLDPTGTFLLAWSERPAIEVQHAGNGVRAQQSLTLHIVRLQEADNG